MESSYSRYLEIIEYDCLEHIDKLIQTREWLQQRIDLRDAKDGKYQKALKNVNKVIKHLYSTL